ncbi:MAG: UpxY family transcription antiterminator [Bacteroidales bacterium]|nr:UpxY family transcription antiterminator [Bacteroidales bacterium]
MGDGKDIAAKWYAVYVKSRFEKKTAWLLERDGVEVYLPLIKRIKQWSDRRKTVEEPLFKSYVFVHTDLRDYFNILDTIGVVKFVCFEGRPVEMPDNQIVAIKEYVGQVENEGEVVVPSDFHEGQLVTIKYGSLKGLQGHLTEILGNHYVVVDIEIVGNSLPMKISKTMIEAISN